jgi:hypothetical protein
MQIDVSELSGGGGLRGGLCHGLSALAVAWANVNVIVRLAIPTAAFVACVSENPVYLGDDRWRWSANGGIGANAWTAEFEASAIGESEVTWAMRISGTLANYDRLLWFDGASDLDANSGEWTYYDPASPDTPVEVIQCDWSLPLATGQDREVIFENVVEGAPAFGDQLRYGLSGSTASVSFVDADVGTTRIEWDTMTGAGTTTNANGDTCCWTERPGHDDTPCL